MVSLLDDPRLDNIAAGYLRKHRHGLDTSEAYDDLRSLLVEVRADGFVRGAEESALHVERHCCVSSCCEAQPGSGEAKSLAECVRSHTKRCRYQPHSLVDSKGASHMTNDELDAKVLAAITKDAGLVLRGVEQRVGGGATSRQVDRSLQRLRKSGRITYGGPGTTFTGWRVVTNETRPPHAQDRRRIP